MFELFIVSYFEVPKLFHFNRSNGVIFFLDFRSSLS